MDGRGRGGVRLLGSQFPEYPTRNLFHLEWEEVTLRGPEVRENEMRPMRLENQQKRL